MPPVNPYALMYHVGSFKLDPNESATENLWRCCCQVCSLILMKRMKRMQILRDEVDEIMSDFVITTYQAFIRTKVMSHTYNRNFTFFQNVYSAAWSVNTRVFTRHFNNVKDRINSIDRIQALSGADEITVRPMPKYLRQGEQKEARADLEKWRHPSMRTNSVKCREQEWQDSLAEVREELFGPGYTPTPIKKKVTPKTK